MNRLSTLAAAPAAMLIARRETLSVAESAAGGLISAALLAVPGASAYFVGGGVIYTGAAREHLLGIGKEEMHGLRAATEAYARLVARRVRERLGTTWGLSETGAAGPTGNRYGDAPGHACIALSGPVELALTVATGSADREANMEEFARRALTLLGEALQKTR
jgi:PncC family amidohydrolase